MTLSPAQIEEGLKAAIEILARQRDEIREAVMRHARTLDDRALGHPEHIARDRDSIDNEMYNVVRAIDPARWDDEVPGLGRTAEGQR